MWHRLLLFLHIRKHVDWAPPTLGPEVNHSYHQHESLACCDHCGGGRLHPIHSKPYNVRRESEVLAIEHQKARAGAEQSAAAVAFDPPYDHIVYPVGHPGYVEREH